MRAGAVLAPFRGKKGPASVSLQALRRHVYRQLEPTAWPGKGLSPVNLTLAALIIVAVVAAVLETEPIIASGRQIWFDDFEVGVAVIFLVEYAARVWTVVENPRFAAYRFPRLRYMVTPIALVDLLAIVPAFFAFGGASSLILRFFRVIRMIRLAKLGRTSRAWITIREALYERRYEFALVLGVVIVAVLVSGSLMWLAEAEAQPDKFGSIPRALWWAIITLTTIGYGDTYPVTALGKVIGGIVGLTGVMLIALPTGLFAASFTEGVQRHRARVEQGEGGAP
ncbi:ion transporter [Sphingomonas sabuli]|uniref:Ion transporter n=1 Tax=Sphingomonas sabuli TaxID=2764186 RepID=A0A7G9L4T5_9SPHN|nr:ion transporter [Sphingomonas sabuli]